jgi:hypothetical protein
MNQRDVFYKELREGTIGSVSTILFRGNVSK